MGGVSLVCSLKDSTILITGASGYIGRNLIRRLRKEVPSCHIIATVRSLEKAKTLFCCDEKISMIEADVRYPLSVKEDIEYIIHAASITSSKQFVENPVDTIITTVDGTRNLLELAKQKQVKSMVFLSTMEIYGAPKTDEKITEDSPCYLSSMSVRSSYPESKRLSETICSAYYKQFGVPVKVARLTQTIGPGIPYDDGRVFAEFARSLIEHRDIVLHTRGLTKRSYISINDAVEAILTILSKGISGEAYNVANEETYCSIYEMAELVAKKISGNEISVRIEEVDTSQFGYAPILKMNLDTRKLQELGWHPEDSLEKMYKSLILYLKEQRMVE